MVEYRKEFFDAVSKILPVKKTQENTISTLFTNEDDGVYFRFVNMNNGVACILKGEKECFNFDEDSVGVYDFNEFYRAFTVLSSPTISINGNKVVFSDERSKLNYVLVDEESLNEDIPFKVFDFPEEHVNINFTSDDFKQLKKILPILNKNAKQDLNVKFTYSDGIVKLHCYRDENNDDSFEMQFTVKEANVESIETVISAEVFDLIPASDYTFRISDEIVNINQENDLLSLNLYVLKSEDIDD